MNYSHNCFRIIMFGSCLCPSLPWLYLCPHALKSCHFRCCDTHLQNLCCYVHLLASCCFLCGWPWWTYTFSLIILTDEIQCCFRECVLISLCPRLSALPHHHYIVRPEAWQWRTAGKKEIVVHILIYAAVKFILCSSYVYLWLVNNDRRKWVNRYMNIGWINRHE